VDLSTNQVVKADYPTLQNFGCNVICSPRVEHPEDCPTNNTVIKNITAYDIYVANNGTNPTVPEFPYAIVSLVIAFASLLVFYRIKLKI
jgi:hypothetical protein